MIFDNDGRTRRPVIQNHHRQQVVFEKRSLYVMCQMRLMSFNAADKSAITASKSSPSTGLP
jgi:hypothetical protein